MIGHSAKLYFRISELVFCIKTTSGRAGVELQSCNSCPAAPSLQAIYANKLPFRQHYGCVLVAAFPVACAGVFFEEGSSVGDRGRGLAWFSDMLPNMQV